MKTIVYLSAIAMIFLCSCRGNSFLTQRYTHFGHATKKQHSSEPAVKAMAYAPAQYTQPAPVEPQQNVQASVTEPVASAAVVNNNSQVIAATKTQNVLHKPAVKENRSLLRLPKTVTKQLDLKKNNSTSSQQHRGLITGVLGLILSIIVTAIVIALIVFLVLLLI